METQGDIKGIEGFDLVESAELAIGFLSAALKTSMLRLLIKSYL